jgi:gamma-glutamyltranspeptidase/glutathione hydrolase
MTALPPHPAAPPPASPRAGAIGPAAVSAAVPQAVEAGLAMLRAGGNAFDAAVAAALVETVVLPMKCGLAGDVVALLASPEEGAHAGVRALLAIGRGPLALAEGAALDTTGPLSVGGFGAPEGYARLSRLGRLGLAAQAAPAIALAREGVAWTPVAVRLTVEAAERLRRWNGAIPFLPGGALPEAGATLRLPGLALLLEQFAARGATLFHGPAGDAVIAHLAGMGGVLRRDDLVRAVATEMPAVCHDLGAAGRLWVTPHPTHGAVLGPALAAHLAGRDAVAAVRDARASFDAAAPGGTSVVTAADAAGNRVVVVHSNSFPQYGACVVVPAFDLVLNNRPGRGFARGAAPDHWNRPDPLSIPATTLNAWHLDRPEAEFWGGTPGGENQAVWNLQVLARLIAGDAPQAAINAPKWGLRPDETIQVEANHPDRAAIGGAAVAPHGLRSALQVLRIARPDGAVTGGADPRTGAVVQVLAGPPDPET